MEAPGDESGNYENLAQAAACHIRTFPEWPFLHAELA